MSLLRHDVLQLNSLLMSLSDKVHLLQQARSLKDFAMKGVEVAKTVKKEASKDSKGSRCAALSRQRSLGLHPSSARIHHVQSRSCNQSTLSGVKLPGHQVGLTYIL